MWMSGPKFLLLPSKQWASNEAVAEVDESEWKLKFLSSQPRKPHLWFSRIGEALFLGRACQVTGQSVECWRSDRGHLSLVSRIVRPAEYSHVAVHCFRYNPFLWTLEVDYTRLRFLWSKAPSDPFTSAAFIKAPDSIPSWETLTGRKGTNAGPCTSQVLDLKREIGPMNAKRERGPEKRWGCLLKCLTTTRAAHLELGGDLSTDSFIMALRRFRWRRGNPKTIRSDNGTNFVGANRELK